MPKCLTRLALRRPAVQNDTSPAPASSPPPATRRRLLAAGGGLPKRLIRKLEASGCSSADALPGVATAASFFIPAANASEPARPPGPL